MNQAYQELEERFQRLARLDHALTFLQWDQLVMMPPGGSENRAAAIAELTAMRHGLLVAEDMEELLETAENREENPERRRSLVEMRREWRQGACLPPELVKAKSLAGSRCEQGWRSQRRDNDWPGFLVNFREVVNLSRQEAQARQAAAAGAFATAYDALLDLYCTGESGMFIAEVFTRLKKELPQLLAAVLDRQPQQAQDLAGTYPVADQQRLGRQLMRSLGFDFEAGRQDVSLHPFSTGDRGDQRITTRFREGEFAEALLAIAHETGHASYESGLPRRWYGLPVGHARNMCIHESQSLLFEKQLFLSKPFLTSFSDHIRAILTDARDFDGERIWKACIRVVPSFIRVEADEVTYPLHVILRFEIERELINGGLEAEEIPEAWDEKMRDYLGLSTKGNDRDGCLQDIHWTDGSFGYFPSYTLGAINAAQLAAAIRRQHPEWRERLARGEVDFLRNWLADKIWSRGSTMESQEIIREATGEGTNPDHFLDHLKARYLRNEY